MDSQVRVITINWSYYKILMDSQTFYTRYIFIRKF